MQRQFLIVALGAGVWLCPLWLGPTLVVPSLIWGAVGLGCLLVLDAAGASGTPSQPLQKQFVLLLLSLGLMIAWRSYSPQNALAAALCLASMALAATLSNKVDGVSCAKWIAWSWLLAGLINGALALCQYLGLTSEPIGQTYGFLRQRNNCATLCNLALIALIYLWHQKELRIGLTAIAAVVLTAALAATVSRAGLLGFMAIVFALVLCRQKRLFQMALLLALAYGVLSEALPALIHTSETMLARLTGIAAEGRLQDSRRPLWQNALVVVSQNPVWGAGWRELDYALHLTDFGAAVRFPGQVDHAHNLILQFAAELGLPFTVLWLALLAAWVIRQQPWRAQKPYQLLAWGALVVMGIHSLLEYPLWYAPFQIATGLAVGLLQSGGGTAKDVVKTMKRTTIRAWTGTALLIFCAYASFDYYRVSQLFLTADKRARLYQNNPMLYAEQSWLFANQVRFAKFLITPVVEGNAAQMWLLGQQVIHFSPEPRVFKALIAAGEWLKDRDPQIAKEQALLQRQLQLLEPSEPKLL